MYEIWKLMQQHGWHIELGTNALRPGSFYAILVDVDGNTIASAEGTSPDEALGYLMETGIEQ